MPDLAIRPFRPGDEPFLSAICCRTGKAGADATGMLSDDALWGDVWVLPYVARHPDLAWVVELREDFAGLPTSGGGDGDGALDASTVGNKGDVVGYVVGTDDTAAFEAWFASEWWPARRGRYVPSDGEDHRERRIARDPQRERDIVTYADSKGRDPKAGDLASGSSTITASTASTTDYATRFPAHLHVDLLPICQRRGLGPRLIALLLDELRAQGVPGLHLGASASNTAACKFYERIGFGETPPRKGEEGKSRVFVWDLTSERMVV